MGKQRKHFRKRKGKWGRDSEGGEGERRREGGEGRERRRQKRRAELTAAAVFTRQTPAIEPLLDSVDVFLSPKPLISPGVFL